MVALAGLAACSDDRPPGLPALGAAIGETSVSGLSSGAYMAGQIQFAHSRHVVGAAIIAGGPYGCAESAFAGLMPDAGAAFLNLGRAVNGCMLHGMRMFNVPNVPLLAQRARTLAAKGRIDPLSALMDDRVYLYSGKADRTVVKPIVEAAARLYTELGLAAGAVRFLDGGPAGHAIVTDDTGLACGRSGSPYVTDCDYDQAGDLLQHIYGSLQPRSAAPRGRYLTFDQKRYSSGGADDAGLASVGVVYLPQVCERQAGCRIHIALHGCSQSREQVGQVFIEGSGFARWADSNRLIVLFPQVRVTAMNVHACWDWWGYTGRDFLTRDAAQIRAIWRMVERLAAPLGS